jgi:hypothetical protein
MKKYFIRTEHVPLYIRLHAKIGFKNIAKLGHTLPVSYEYFAKIYLHMLGTAWRLLKMKEFQNI